MGKGRKTVVFRVAEQRAWRALRTTGSQGGACDDSWWKSRTEITSLFLTTFRSERWFCLSPKDERQKPRDGVAQNFRQEIYV